MRRQNALDTARDIIESEVKETIRHWEGEDKGVTVKSVNAFRDKKQVRDDFIGVTLYVDGDLSGLILTDLMKFLRLNNIRVETDEEKHLIRVFLTDNTLYRRLVGFRK